MQYAIAYLRSPAFALPVVDGIHKAGVVPVLDDIIRSVVDLHLDGVPTIVDQEYYAVLLAPQHGRHILCCHLRKMESPGNHIRNSPYCAKLQHIGAADQIEGYFTWKLPSPMQAITRLSFAPCAYPSNAPTDHPIEPYCIWNSYLQMCKQSCLAQGQ